MKIAITTDSNSGILPNEYMDKGVFVLLMPFLIDGELYFENVNLTQEQFYEKLTANAEVSTSQPSVGEVTEFWTEILKEYDFIVHIPMSSALSKSCETAQILAKDFNGKVFVVDNKRISVPLKQSVLDAVALRENGKNAQEIAEYLEETGSCSSIYIAVDSMKYLKKGGRVTPAAAMIGTILKIKPVLQIQGGKLDRYALVHNLVKAKIAMKTAIKNDLEKTFASYKEKGEMAIYVAHTQNLTQAEIFVEELKKEFPDIPVLYCEPLPLSVSCHIGPGALAVSCTRRFL